MSEDIKAVVLDVLGSVAPEADLDALDPDENLREALDIDSMDALNVVIALHERLGIDIPEADYSRLATLKGMIAYLEAKRA